MFTLGDVLNHKHGRSFEAWLDKVGAHLRKTVGLSYSDLSDQPYRDWFNDKVSPATAAKRALADNGFEG